MHTKRKKGKTKVTNNGTINNNNITINIIPPSNEQSKTLLPTERDQIMICSHESLYSMITYTNFNDVHPEQKNIMLRNLKSKYIDIHNGERWIKQLTDPVIQDVFDNYVYMFQELYENYSDEKNVWPKNI